MRVVIAELDNGEQEFFDRLADALAWAKKYEDMRHHSVDYIAICDTDSDSMIVYRGQELRNRIRAGNLMKWISSG